MEATSSERQQRLVELLVELLESDSLWNQTTFAKSVGVSQATVNRWLNGTNLPDVGSNNFKALAKSTGGTPESLLDYLDGKISLEQYRQAGKYAEDKDESRRRVSEIKADIARLPHSEILEIIIFSASALREKP
jgi:transcriptional regulator with XRE-family HTH domain